MNWYDEIGKKLVKNEIAYNVCYRFDINAISFDYVNGNTKAEIFIEPKKFHLIELKEPLNTKTFISIRTSYTPHFFKRVYEYKKLIITPKKIVFVLENYNFIIDINGIYREKIFKF